MSDDLNATLRFYLVVLPPVMVGLMALAEILVWLILSSEFQPVAGLLLLFIPAEMFRVLGETMTVPLLARRRMLPFTLIYLAQATIFVAAATLLVPLWGVAGAAAAYGTSTVAGAAIDAVIGIAVTGVTIHGDTLRIGLVSVALLAAVAITCFLLPLGWQRLVICVVLLGLWLLANSRNSEFTKLLRSAIRFLTPKRA
jgi:O-antigen/teichoic acid export membrane protein